MTEEYSEKVLEVFKNPKNVGEIKNPDGVGEIGNISCGDVMKLSIKVEDDKIKDIKFKTFGCAAAIATASMVTELAKGKSLDEAENLGKDDVAKALQGLPAIKMHCSNLATEALKKAIDDYRSKK